MATCPDSNPNTSFNDLIVRLTPKTTNRPLQRKHLYYMVCFFFRLSLYNLVFLFRREKWVHMVVGIGALLSFLQLYVSDTNNRQWWSKKFQMIMAFLLLFTTTGFILNLIPNYWTPLLLYLSLFGGLLQSFKAKWC